MHSLHGSLVPQSLCVFSTKILPEFVWSIYSSFSCTHRIWLRSKTVSPVNVKIVISVQCAFQFCVQPARKPIRAWAFQRVLGKSWWPQKPTEADFTGSHTFKQEKICLMKTQAAIIMQECRILNRRSRTKVGITYLEEQPLVSSVMSVKEPHVSLFCRQESSRTSHWCWRLTSSKIKNLST